MAITKLMHMKEAPDIPHIHLKNAIDYILDVKHGGKKTDFGRYVGGNAGTRAADILRTMLDTKEEYGKLYGRQGYHFVISCAPGEADLDTVYALANDFCSQYLSENYDYVYAVHNDSGHVHAHIIFNSVSRTTGYKYHYQKGDWEKNIQPVTDRACQKLGLPPLIFQERDAGISYAEWAYKKAGRMNWTHIVRADIDLAISRSETYEDFLQQMKKMNYSMRVGWSKKRNAHYVTYTFTDENGKRHSRRSYNIPGGYESGEIKERIRNKSTGYHEQLLAGLSDKTREFFKPQYIEFRQHPTFSRMYQAVSYYRLPNPYAVPQGQVRRDMLRIDRLLDECRYLKQKGITDIASLIGQKEKLENEITALTKERKRLYGILDLADPAYRMKMDQYRSLQLRYDAAIKEHDDNAEHLQDAMAALEEELPTGAAAAAGEMEAVRLRLKAVNREKGLVEEIIRTSSSAVQERSKTNKQPGVQHREEYPT